MSHKIFEVQSQEASIGGPSVVPNVSSLSRSSTARLKIAFAGGPQHVAQQDAPTAGFPPVQLSREGYREYYEDQVMGGSNAAYVDNLGDIYFKNYFQNGAPNFADPQTPEGEATAGTEGSTIVASNLGPNVSTKGGDVVDATPTSSPPFSGNGKANPHVTSVALSNSELHGTKGESSAS